MCRSPAAPSLLRALTRCAAAAALLACSVAFAQPSADKVGEVGAPAATPPSAVPVPSPPPMPVQEPSAADFARELKDQLLSFHVEFWRGMQVYQGGRPLVGFGGDDTHLNEVLDAFPESKEARARGRMYRLTGTILLAAGAIPLAGSVGYFVYGSETRGAAGLSTGALIGLLAVTLVSLAAYTVGAVLLNRAVAAQLDAVNLYNAALLNRQLPPREQLRPENVVSFATTF